MISMITFVLEQLKRYSLKEKDLGAFAKIDKNGMHFKIRVFDVEKLGNLSIVEMNAMLGLMKMETIVLTPLEVDMPLFSFDGIRAMGSSTLLLELYDTQLQPYDCSAFEAIKDKYAHLPDRQTEPRWYDPLHLPGTLSKKGRNISAGLEALEKEFLSAYMLAIPGAEPCSREQKQAKVYDYADKLVKLGGPAIDQFKKMIGEEEAALLFKKYIFGAQD